MNVLKSQSDFKNSFKGEKKKEYSEIYEAINQYQTILEYIKKIFTVLSHSCKLYKISTNKI